MVSPKGCAAVHRIWIYRYYRYFRQSPFRSIRLAPRPNVGRGAAAAGGAPAGNLGVIAACFRLSTPFMRISPKVEWIKNKIGTLAGVGKCELLEFLCP